MEKNLIYLTSEFETEIKVNDIYLGSISPPYFNLAFETDEPRFYINSHPLNTYSAILLPNTIKLEYLNNKYVTNDQFCALTELEPHKYLLKITHPVLEKAIFTQPYSKNLDGTTVNVYENLLNVANQSNQIFFPLKHSLTDINATQIQNHIFLTATTSDNKQFALIINKNLQIRFETIADKIEFDGKRIIELNKLCSIANHGRVTIFSLNESDVKETDTYLTYIDKIPTPPANNFSIPQAFLECVMLKDFSLARSFLHPTLNSTLDDSTLTNFFGNFVSILTTSISDSVTLALTYDAKPQFVKYFTFSLSNSHITNINSK